MVSIKEAAENALAFARATLGSDMIADAGIEEVESIEASGGEAWIISLSILDPDEGFLTPKRLYKTFTVLKKDGEVTKMKIRELAGA